MPKIAYREQRFNSKARKTVEQAKLIIDDMMAQGYVLTLRQLYYQFVSRNWIANKEQEYKRLGRIICDAREVGEIDWLAIEDRGRAAHLQGHVPSPEEVLKGIEYGLRLDPWLEQDVYCEAWVEKAALEGVVERPASRWRVPYMACKGYLSASEAWRAGRRFEKAIANGKRPVLFHLGDHDPSGIHMTKDNRDRLSMFSRMGVDVRRIALNMDQVEEYGPPPNPAKQTDSRYAGYEAEHGKESWELDALSPKVIDDLLQEGIKSVLDMDKYEATLAREKDEREPLRLLGLRWEEVKELALCGEVHPMRRLAEIDRLRLDHPNLLLRSLPSSTVYVRPELADEPEDEEDEGLYDVDDPMDPGYED